MDQTLDLTLEFIPAEEEREIFGNRFQQRGERTCPFFTGHDLHETAFRKGAGNKIAGRYQGVDIWGASRPTDLNEYVFQNRMVFENPLGSVDNGVISWQGRSDSGVHLEPFYPHPKGRTHPGQDDQDKNISRFPFDKGSKSAHFRSLKGIKILIATSRAKVRVLRQKSSQGLKWETLSSRGP